jgi:hypothetical protein
VGAIGLDLGGEFGVMIVSTRVSEVRMMIGLGLMGPRTFLIFEVDMAVTI